jgi:hypothetical protein
MRTGWTGPGNDLVRGSCENIDKPFDSINGEEFLDQPSDYQLLKAQSPSRIGLIDFLPVSIKETQSTI